MAKLLVPVLALVLALTLLGCTQPTNYPSADQPPTDEPPTIDDPAPQLPLATYSATVQSIHQLGSPTPGHYTARITYTYSQDPQQSLARPQRPTTLRVVIGIVTNNRGVVESTVVVDDISPPLRQDQRVVQTTVERTHHLQDVTIVSVESLRAGSQ